MAGISQNAPPIEIMPLLAHSISQAGHNGPTAESVLLLRDYVAQARELQKLAGPGNSIHVANCADAGKLLQIIGYRLQHGCGGQDVALETATPERAFLTIDSGFPVTDLEEALQKNVPFSYAYASSRVPELFREADWVALSTGQKLRLTSCLDILLNDDAVAGLYWGLSKMDIETAHSLQRSFGLHNLLAVAPVLDFYGSQISIRAGRVLVPGGPGAEPAWKALVGASPQAPAAFVSRLLAKDNGWLAAYFDVLSRVDATEQEHLTQAARLQAFYDAFRQPQTKNKAAAHTFRQASDLLVLDTRLRWEANGEPHIPGSLEVWETILKQRSSARIVRDSEKHTHALDPADALLGVMTAFSREETETGPLQLYLTLSEIDHRRPASRQLSPDAVLLLASHFSLLRHWYLLFSDFPELTDDSLARFVQVVESLERIRNTSLRANAIGAFQADLGLWQILARQHEISSATLDASWQKTLTPFSAITTAPQLFNAAYLSLGELLQATGEGANTLPGQIVDRLAGPVQQTPEGQRIHDVLAARIHAVLEDQQLVSLDTLFALGNGLEKLAHGEKADKDNLLGLAGELRGFELPRPIFTNGEKVSWAPGVYVSHHAELQIQTDLTRVIKAPGTAAQLEAARGQLAPFLRDTLVGLNYAYYEPPGAEILHTNPVFVRAHDFLDMSAEDLSRSWRPATLRGVGVSAGGGAYLTGSLVDLPFSLAQAEENFLVPENVQALIWKELVPELVKGAVLPRWWTISPIELHAVALYQRSGEELLRAAATDSQIRAKVVSILASRLSPQRLEDLESSFAQEKNLSALLPRLMPAETFYLAEQYRRISPEQAEAAGPANKELAALVQHSPAAVNRSLIADHFGIPHPVLAQTNTLEILDVSPFPLFSGSANRLFGESLESCNLYWARLADDLGYSPAMLHLLVPELTRHMIGKIFATNIEDWPALLRAMQETGDDLRKGRIASLRRTGTPSVDQAAQIPQRAQEIQ